MGLNERIMPNQKPTGTTALTGAAPQTITGNTLPTNQVETGTLGARVYAKATTNTLTITGKWQVSDNGSTWVDSSGGANAPANVTLVTGTGAAVTSTIDIPAPSTVYGRRYARFLLVSGVGVGGGLGTDEGSVAYNYRLPSPLTG